MDANAENVSKKSMTPSEKKAREIERTLDLYYAETDEDVMKGNQAKASRIDAIASALSETERRGFERAKRMTIKTLQDYDCIYLLENLRYEDSHDEA